METIERFYRTTEELKEDTLEDVLNKLVSLKLIINLDYSKEIKEQLHSTIARLEKKKEKLVKEFY